MGFQNTELWKLFKKKAEQHFSVEVEKLCKAGEDLSAAIIKFFPNFTRHDAVHIEGVCNWMTALLDENTNLLTVEEAAMLLLAACWHDSGMSVTPQEEANLIADMKAANKPEWKTYFTDHHGDACADYLNNDDECMRICRNFIRENHHKRARQKLQQQPWNPELRNHGITLQLLADLCQSHGEELKGYNGSVSNKIDFVMCAILLRLADLLDYDENRAPDVLFRYMGLDHPQTEEVQKSRQEQLQNIAGVFQPEDDHITLRYYADCYHPDIDEGITGYLAWARKELDKCTEIQRKCRKEHWKNLQLPTFIQEDITPHGYTRGNFRLTMDQERIVSLLAGENLYSNPGVFVRELLQNAIDAVLNRADLDSDFDLADGKIDIYTWKDDEGYAWFRIEDNGTGMDQYIIENYFLKVGCSYYTSDDFRSETRKSRKKTGFRPTSRFGIGILSCFLSDKERNRVEVETMRYTDDGTPLRLFVPKLKGNYFLLTPDKLDDPANGYMESPKELQMPPGADGITDRFASYEAGTTVCVRTSQFRMGGQSFRELLDRYIVYPKVRIVHHDLDGDGEKTYLTQAEFKDTIGRLIGVDAETKQPAEMREIIHPLPERCYERLKHRMPEWEWSEETRPQIVFTYQRCDTLSENTAGFILWFSIRTTATCKKTVLYEGKEIVPCLDCRIGSFSDNSLYMAFDVFLNGEHFYEDNAQEQLLRRQLHSLDASFELEFSEIEELLQPEEKVLWNYWLHNKKMNSRIAYNGVLAAVSDHFMFGSALFTLLFHGGNYPEVDMAREQIRSLPLGTLCETALLHASSPVLDDASQWKYASESEFRAVFEQHPEWEARLTFRLKDAEKQIGMTELDAAVRNGCVFDLIDEGIDGIYDIVNVMQLTALKKRYAVGVTVDGRKWNLRISAFNADQPTEELCEFPPLLFLNDMTQCRKNEGIFRAGYMFNPAHRFSQWLIGHREQLQETMPEQYQAILSAMMSKFSDDILEAINKILHTLRNMRGVSFGIPADLKLTYDDFDARKWLSE